MVFLKLDFHIQRRKPLKLRNAVLSIETGCSILPDTTCIGEIVRVLPSKDHVIVAYVRPQNEFKRFVEAY